MTEYHYRIILHLNFNTILKFNVLQLSPVFFRSTEGRKKDREGLNLQFFLQLDFIKKKNNNKILFILAADDATEQASYLESKYRLLQIQTGEFCKEKCI